MKYKEGDVIVREDGNKRKVLGVCGMVYHMSGVHCLNEYEDTFTEAELDEAGYTLDDQEAELNFLIEQKEQELEELYKQHRDLGGME